MPDMVMHEILNLRESDGDYGVEIEMEGFNLDPINRPEGWKVDGDGSLRNGGVEWILRQPLKYEEAQKAILSLKKALDNADGKIQDCIRAGVHIHMNVQKFTPKEFAVLTTVWLAVEDVITNFCGDDRTGNLFCLRTRDAEYVLAVLAECFRNEHFEILRNDAIRYAAMNFMAITKYGSLENRTLKTPTNLKEILPWLEIMHELHMSHKLFKDPQEVVIEFSRRGGERFLRKIFPKSYERLIKSCPQWERFLWDGIRNAQDIAFCRDWDTFFNVKNESPFKVDDLLLKQRRRQWR